MAYADALSIPFYKTLRQEREEPRALSRKEAVALEIGNGFDSELYDRQMSDLSVHSEAFDNSFRKELAPFYGDQKIDNALYHLNRPAGALPEDGEEGWLTRLMRKASSHGLRPEERRREIKLDKSLSDYEVKRMGIVDRAMDADRYASFADWPDLREYRGALKQDSKWFKAGKGLCAFVGPVLGAAGAITLIGDVMTARANSDTGYSPMFVWDANQENDIASYRMYHVPYQEIADNPDINDPVACGGGTHRNWYMDTILHDKTNHVLRGLETGKLHWAVMTAYDTEKLESDPTENVLKFVAIMPGNMDRISPGSENRVDGYDKVKFDRAYRNARYGIYTWEADLNGDGRIDSIDYNIFRSNYGKLQPNELGLVFIGEEGYTADWCTI